MTREKQSITLIALLRRLVKWFLGKADPKLETFEEEVIEGDRVRLIRYRRKTARAYRTWRAVYLDLDYAIVFGFDTLEYIPDVPAPKKRNRLSTHLINIYRQGRHAKFNPIKRVHEPDIEVLLHDEVCLELVYMEKVLNKWKALTAKTDQPIYTKYDLYDRVIDEIAKCAIRHPPSERSPLAIDWRSVVEDTVHVLLGDKKHRVFPAEDSEVKIQISVPRHFDDKWRGKN